MMGVPQFYASFCTFLELMISIECWIMDAFLCSYECRGGSMLFHGPLSLLSHEEKRWGVLTGPGDKLSGLDNC